MTLTLHPSRKAGRVLTLLSLTGLCAAALPAQAALTTLASFTGSGDIGSGPYAGVTLDDSGNLFGNTQFGGASGGGTVYEIKNGTSAITTLASFTGAGAGTNGGSPEGVVTFDSTGNLFGTTYQGGTSGFGTVYEIDKGSSIINTLASFTGAGDNGSGPFSGVSFDKSGNLFGTTSGGGVFGGGTVYEIDKLTGIFTTLASFTEFGTSSSDPFAGVTFDSKGNLFGTTFLGGDTGVGTVYEIDKGSSIINTLASFNVTNGRSPAAGVIFDSKGNLFGTTNAGGAHDAGTVYEIAYGSSTITTLASFTGAGGNGSSPAGGVTLDGGGNLFGTTFHDGEFGNGTVYEIAYGSSIITTLVSFTGTNGGNPASAVTFDKSGNLFGTTYGGGDSSGGTVYEIAGAGSPVPESSTVISFATLLGLGGLLLRARKHRQNATPGA